MTTDPRTPRRKPRGKFSPLKALRFFTPIVFFIVLCVVMCVPSRRTAPAPGDTPEPVVERLLEGRTVNDLEAVDTVTYFKCHLENMPEPTQRMHVNYFGDMRKAFNDSNHIHMAEALQYGLTPLTDTRSHWQLRRPIVKVTSCEDYFIDSLVYSRPYLVPEAAGRLREIGRRFRDTIAARGGGDYRIKVTSLLRTPVTVKKLRRVNVNATSESTHNYGTTFDISYSKFIYDGPGDPSRTFEDLKNLLAEVLEDMRRAGRCYIKFEYKQSCFHITARPVTQ